MKKDIEKPEVKNVTIAVAKNNEAEESKWAVYLINKNDFPLKNTLVTSKGYGHKDGKEQKTSTLRHFLEIVPPHEPMAIEAIIEEVFHLNNEYWVSYYIGKTIYDKKFVFVPDTIITENFSYIKELDAEGVLHS